MLKTCLLIDPLSKRIRRQVCKAKVRSENRSKEERREQRGNAVNEVEKMLRITTSHSAEAAKNYFDVALKTSDYYTKDVGTWGGRGAEILGLKGDVQRKDFVALANNKRPGANGKRLTARTNKTRLE